MHRQQTGALALVLALTLALPAADFGTIPDPYTGNWSGTLVANGREEPLHATVIAYQNWYEVTLRTEPDPRKAPIVILHGTTPADHLVLEPTLSPLRSQGLAGLNWSPEWMPRGWPGGRIAPARRGPAPRPRKGPRNERPGGLCPRPSES